MNRRTKELAISKKVKMTVWERDRHRCILCGSPSAMPSAHYISRAKGGLGIEQNIVTLCFNCHRRLDQTTERKELLLKVKRYLNRFYPGFDDEKRIYHKT